MKQKLIFLAAFFTTAFAFSAEYYVDASRTDDTGFATNWATAKQTIQAAVDLTIDGDTVWVTNGAYRLSSEISVTNAVAVQSVNGRAVTTVDGGGSNRCFKLSGECLVSGFTMTNGFASGDYNFCGGGVFCVDLMPMVSNCVITGNGVDYFRFSHGGGMHNGVAVDCVFEGNTALAGGGMSGGVASNCLFVGNLANGYYPLVGIYTSNGGGGMQDGKAYHCVFSNNVSNAMGGGKEGGEAHHCTFVDNAAWGGGGVSCMAYQCLILRNRASLEGGGASCCNLYNCTVIGNSAYLGGGMAGDFPVVATRVAYNCVFLGNIATEDGNDLWRSQAYNSCATQLVHGVDGNITNAPQFMDAAGGDFRLMSNSPCINWGNNSVVSNATDLDGNPRIVEDVVDMGAYEYQGILGLSDSDGDGIPDDWERQHGGNQNSERTCSNGINNVRQAYIAGLDPNDPADFFDVSNVWNVLGWNAISGRVYSVYWTTNLLDGFQPLETNIPWTAGSFTDTNTPSSEQMFYKIEVRFDDGEEAAGGGGDDGDERATQI